MYQLIAVGRLASLPAAATRMARQRGGAERRGLGHQGGGEGVKGESLERVQLPRSRASRGRKEGDAAPPTVTTTAALSTRRPIQKSHRAASLATRVYFQGAIGCGARRSAGARRFAPAAHRKFGCERQAGRGVRPKHIFFHFPRVFLPVHFVGSGCKPLKPKTSASYVKA